MSVAYFYGIATQALPSGAVDWNGHTIKAMLVGASYVFNQDTHDDMGDISGEITATGYTAGGFALVGKTNTRSGVGSILDSDDPIWATADMANVYGLVLYDDTVDIPLIYVDFAGAYGQVGGVFVYPVPPEGWATILAQDAP